MSNSRTRKARGAQETQLTNQVAEKILSAKRGGASNKAAGAFAGINESTLSRWLHRTGEPYETFTRLMGEAEQYPKLFLLDGIMANAYSDPDVALKLLERLEPETYGKVIVMVPPGGVGGSLTQNFNLSLGQALEKAIATTDQLPGMKTLGSNGVVVEHIPKDPRPPKGS
jgi:hypothetical protein